MTEVTDVVAGAGIWGCTLARRLAEAGRKVLVLERRPVVGGNVRCEVDAATGIEIHTYGSHIFHTHLEEVWEFVNRFVRFNGYQHKVLASYRGRIYHLPLGLTLVNKFFGVELKPTELAAFLDDPADYPNPQLPGVRQPRRAALFDAFFRGYTSKQWGRPPEAIDPSIIQRVPVRSNYDTNYFNDYNQGIPLTGYNSLFDRLLDHPNIAVETSRALNPDDAALWLGRGVRVFYSGPLDEFFAHRFGSLPWRTLRFERETLPVADYQGTSVVNFTEAEVPYTRVHEFRHYHPESRGALVLAGQDPAALDYSRTIVMREYSATWQPGDEPYYPVDTPESQALLARYQAEVDSLNRQHAAAGARMVVGGRLGGYKYFDMDRSIAAALAVEIEGGV